jgi:hypothetical protein
MRTLVLIVCIFSFSSIGTSQTRGKQIDGIIEYTDNKTFDLEGRKIVFVPDLNMEAAASAKIVLQIRVKKNGKVVSVKSNSKLTNTNDQALIKESIDKAYLYKFSRCSTCNKVQIGTITFRYVGEL